MPLRAFPPKPTIVHLEALVVSAPFIDRAPVTYRYLGYYSSLDASIAWATSSDPATKLELRAAVDRLLFIRATELATDVDTDSYRGHALLSPTGEVLQQCTPDDEMAWHGRAPETCRWQLGDIACCVSHRQYRIGIVRRLPPSTEWVNSTGISLDRSDDVYLLAFEGDFDHDHPHQARMFEPLAKVPASLRRGLQQRLDVVSGTRRKRRARAAQRSSLALPIARPKTDDLPPRRSCLPPTCCFQTDAGFAFTSVGPQCTGIEGATIWFSYGEFAPHISPLGPRLLIAPMIAGRPRRLSNAASVQLTPPFEIRGILPKKMAAQAVQFVAQNRGVLLRHWRGKNDSVTVLEQLKPA